MGKNMNEMSIEIENGLTKIRNHSKTHKLIITRIPRKPKRKYIDIDFILKDTCKINFGQLDLTSVCFRWVE